MNVIIFTDLDGSLLNHGDYSFAEAAESLDRIQRSRIPLIMTTSKTRREVEVLQREMGLREPFIVENGGGIFFPDGYRDFTIAEGERQEGYILVRIGTTYPAVRRFMTLAGERFDMKGFGDMTPDEISALTGLSLAQAAMAKDREFTEPFLWKRSEDLGRLSSLAAEHGLKVTRGGRFHHLIGRNQDKGKAVRLVRDIFKSQGSEAKTAVGIGDSENDLPMLEQVDIPVLIPRPGEGHLDFRLPGLLRAKEAGAGGWNAVVQEILNVNEKTAAKGS